MLLHLKLPMQFSLCAMRAERERRLRWAVGRPHRQPTLMNEITIQSTNSDGERVNKLVIFLAVLQNNTQVITGAHTEIAYFGAYK